MTTGQEKACWNTAREKLLDLWGEIVDRIDEQDRARALALAGGLEEFCDRGAIPGAQASGEPPGSPGPLAMAPTQGASGQCALCRGFLEVGGCLGVLDEIRRAVHEGRWEWARSLAGAYLRQLEMTGQP